MNIILFGEDEQDISGNYFFTKNDPRYQHCKKILRLKKGDKFKAGLIGSDLGAAMILEFDNTKLIFEFKPTGKPAPLFPVEIVLGFPRPIQLKRCLKDVATFGVRCIHLVPTDLGEASYLKSDLANPSEMKKFLLEGATQAGSSILPETKIYKSINHFFTDSSFSTNDLKIIFDLNEETKPIYSFLQNTKRASIHNIVLAIGNERGWTNSERHVFTAQGFNFCSLGNRILKTETSVTASLAIVLSVLGFW